MHLLTIQTDFSNEFNISADSLPNLVAYVPSKKVFANFIGTFEEDNVKAFIDRVLQGKVAFNNLNTEKLKFSSTPCEKIREEIDTSDDDELLREIIEEDKKKREEFEREREKSGDGKKKKKKKKKTDL